jgi:serine protease Do
MNLPILLRKPLIAAVVGAATVAVPVSALYATRALATTAAATAAAPAAAVATPAIAGVPDFASMVQRYGPAVVNITVVTKVSAMNQGEDEGDDQGQEPGGEQNPFGPNSPFAPFFKGQPFQGPQQQQPMRGEGSGFIIRNDGVILTNAHVVNGATEVTVRMTDRREYTAKVLGVDTRSDVAVIKINAHDLPTVKLGDSRQLKVGEWVLAIGAPFGFENSATAGIVSAKGRTLDSGYVPFIQTDVPINPGNSGGPLFNMRGEVVGINSQIYSRSGGFMGVSFSIPIDVAVQVSNQLESTGHVTRGKIGVQIQRVSQGLSDSFGLPQPEGALVASVEKGGPAAEAGIEAGDVILKLNGQPLSDSNELPSLVAGMAPGTTVNLEIWRNHASRNVSVKLGALEDKRTASNHNAQADGGKLGLAVRPLSPEERSQSNVKNGLLVERASGPAADAGIQPGDVVLSANGTPVTSADELKSLVEKSKGHIALLIQRGDAQIFVPVRVG